MRSIATGSANPAAASASKSQAYCQMPNHVHLILTPADGEAEAAAFAPLETERADRPAARIAVTVTLNSTLAAWPAIDPSEIHRENECTVTVTPPLRR